MGRPRYLEDEGGPRPGSHLRRAPPARPPGPNPTERVQSPGERAAERGAGAPGGARGTRSPGAGRSPAPPLAKRHGKQQPSPEMATRGVSASPHKGPGWPGARGPGWEEGREGRGGRGRPGLGPLLRAD